MKKFKMLMLLIIATMSTSLTAQKLYSKEEIALDLAYLKTKLEQNHPNLYTYNSKAEVDQWFKQQTTNLAPSLNEKDALKLITSISALIKDGHSYIYPSAKHLEDFFNTAPLFPLDVFRMNDNLIVVNNHSSEQNIPIDARLTRINGVEVAKIQSTIVQHTCRDGDNLEYAKHLAYQFFPAYYSYFYGFQEKFEIEYQDKSGALKTAIIRGLKRNEIKANKNNTEEKGIQLHLLSNSKSAILRIKSFDNKILKGDYGQSFKKEITEAFNTIAKNKIEHLAIDLRDNQGGELSNGVYLLQYFMDSTFQCVHSYYVLKSGQRKQLNTKWDNYFEPKQKDHFDETVFLLINGGSYSCSAIVANTFKENKRGQVIGQMSGGSAYVNSGGPNEMLTLPNTKIIFTIPKTQYNLREDLSKIGLGVIPDIEIPDTPYRIEDQDTYLIKFIELTQNNNQKK